MSENKPAFKKHTYRISQQLSNEEIRRRMNTITLSEIQTAAYLTKLDAAPNISDTPPYCYMRFKG